LARSHFERAALTVTKTELDRLEALSRSLFDCVQGIKGFGRQTYNFANFANSTAMIVLGLSLLLVTSYIPFRPQPEKAFLRLLRRFFWHGEFLMSLVALDRKPHTGWKGRQKMMLYQNDILELPQKLAVWGGQIDHRLFPGNTPEKVQTLVNSLQTLALRIKDLLDARKDPQLPLLVRELIDDVRPWHVAIGALEKQVEAARADVEAANATIKQAEAAVKGYTGRVEEMLKEYRRQQSLDKQGATSKRMVEEAKANWVAAVNQKANAEAQMLQMQASLAEANANLAKAKADLGAPGDQNAQVRLAKAKVRSAELNLEFTRQKAAVDGYVTNLNLRLGSQAVENQPIMALVDVNSYWVTGFFRENYIEDIRKGDRANVTLMSYPDKPLEGRVDSLGWGIAQDDASTGYDLLPNINPTFEWIRLA
jgi:hypothetical protein